MTEPARRPPRERLSLWAPVALLLAVETWLSGRPQLPSLPIALPAADKLAHLVYFFVTGAAAARAARLGEGWSRKRTSLTLLPAALAYGLLDEAHQSLVGRTVEALDVAADVAGVALATTLPDALLRRQPGSGPRRGPRAN